MLEVKFNRDGIEETATIISGAGYNDGYYRECSATVIYNDVEYSIQDAGSGSGYIPDYSSISINGPKKLVSIMQLCENHLDDIDIDEQGYLCDVVVSMLEAFFEHGCKESYEVADYGAEVRIDGKEV